MNVFRRGLLSSAVVCRTSEGASATQAGKRSSVALMALLALAGALVSTRVAVADPTTYTFSFSGGGISASGVFDLAPTGTANTDQITGISGYFSDTTAGISGAITGLEPAALPGPPPFVPPGFTATFSYDNLFYTDGNSPLVCPPDTPGGPPGYPFGGGFLDIYGVAFEVGPYVVDLWSNGDVPGAGLTYEVSDALGAQLLEPDNEGQAVPVSLTTAATPEPGSLLLLTAGLPGLIAVVRRKMTRASV
jgi:hypothetical protein